MKPGNSMLEAILNHKTRFVGVFLLVFAVSYSVLYAVDFYPEPPENTANEAEETQTAVEEAQSEPDESVIETEDSTPSEPNNEPALQNTAALPTQISFPSLNRTVTVKNPQSSSVAVLDAALLEGAVRHPDSATFQDNGTMFILGHSSYLPNVMNSNFQAFNGIQKLKWGDTITVQSADAEYTYRVERVYEAKASNANVAIADTGSRLVLATCNSFASKDDRFVVEAELVSSRVL